MRSQTMLRCASMAAAVTIVALTSPRLEAQTPKEIAAAKQAFREGEEAENKGDLPLALARFEAALSIKETPQLLIRVGAVKEKMGRLVEAAAAYRKGLEKAAGLPAVAKVAKEQLDAVEQQIPAVVIEVPAPPPGLTLTLDGAPVGGSSFGARLPIDPGEHRLHAEAPGHAPREETFTAAPRQTARVRVELAPVVVALAPPPSKLPGALVTAAGGAALIAGAVLLGVSYAKDGSINDLCGGPERLRCPLSRKDEIEGDVRAANALRFSGVGAGAVGAAGAAVGIWMLVRSARPPSAALTVTPIVGGGLSGVAVSGSF